MNTDKNIEKIVAQVGDLPAVPKVVGDVLSMTEDPSVPMARVGEVIQRDPALTAKILRIGNSPYYGMRQYVGTLKLALVILGAREVRNIVVGIAVLDTLRNESTDVLLTDDFWNHSLTVAAIAKKMGTAMTLGHQGEDFIVGLLHDVGKMVLCRQLGDRYAAVHSAAEDEPETLPKLERDELGFTHADAGAALASRWNLPEILCDALYLHHPAEDRSLHDAKDPLLAATVRIANLAAHHDFEQTDEAGCRACADQEAWATLETAGSPIAPDQRYALLAEFMKDLEDSPKLTF